MRFVKLLKYLVGVGSAPHIYGELFKMMTGINMVHVPYRGNAPALTDLLGGHVQVVGRLVNRAGHAIAAAQLQVFSSSEGAAEQLVGNVQTDASGAYSYTAAGSTSRTLRFAYAGSPLILPAQSSVRIVVPAVGSVAVVIDNQDTLAAV